MWESIACIDALLSDTIHIGLPNMCPNFYILSPMGLSILMTSIIPIIIAFSSAWKTDAEDLEELH